MSEFQYADNLAGLEGLSDMDVLNGLEDAELGARVRAQRSVNRGRMPFQAPAGLSQQAPIRSLVAPISGVPARGLRKSYLPMGAIAFIVGGLTSLPITVQPQKPFRPMRVVFDFARSNAGGSANGLLTMTDLSVGQNRQPAAAGAAPLGAFAPTAFDVDVDFDPANTSINVSAQVAISAAPTVAGDRVDVSGVLFGFMIG